MGRQLQLVTTSEDIQQLLNVINKLSPIKVFKTPADSEDALWIDDWQSPGAALGDCKAWLTEFPWTPENKSGRGFWYVSNTGAAPILEISASHGRPIHNGRIYWSKYFSAPEGLSYDVNAFSKNVDRIWGWIRRHSHRASLGRYRDEAYFLPNAWKLEQLKREQL